MRTAEQNKRAQVAYDTAYFVLPRSATTGLEELKAEFEQSPDLGAMFYYLLAARMRGETPNPDDVRALRGHTGRLDGERNYIVMEYPRFPAVDLMSCVNGGVPVSFGTYVLAPYFSAVIEDRNTREAECFVLGQSPDARTTLRLVTSTMNANLGRGCEPELDAFLELLRQRLARR